MILNKFTTQQVSELIYKLYSSLSYLAEDTFLLLDALEQEAEALRKERPLICLEVG